MIPIHHFSNQNAKAVKVNRLNELTNYDFGEPHRHNYFEFFVFSKGGGTHMIDFKDYTIETNSIHIVAPGQVHQMKRALDSKGFVILFETDVFESNHFVTNFLFDHICLSEEECAPDYHFTKEKENEIRTTIESIWSDYRSDAALKNEFVLSNLSVLLIQCMRSRKTPVSAQDSRNQNSYAQFRRLLKNNFKQIKKVKEYAQALSISEKQLNEIIQARTGQSASAIIYQQLILEAKRLLKTGISSKEVAFDLNFDDPAHFSKFFKTQTGVSPSDFLKIQD